MSELESFWQQLNGGPAVLFLGQEYLKLETGNDPLLTQVRHRFGESVTDKGYDSLWRDEVTRSGDSALAWVSERCRHLPPPEWLSTVGDYAWSAVLSTAIDSMWLSAFRNEWRQVAPIYEDRYYPTNPRNRRELHCTFLFGSVDQTEINERPPLTQLEYFARQQTARNLAQRLPDMLTPLGVLAIEGYDFETDWLTLPDLYPIIQAMGSKQAHYFGVKEERLTHPILSDLVRNGKLLTHPMSLAAALEQARSLGVIQLGPQNDWEGTGRRVRVRKRSVVVPRDLWNRVKDSGTILDDDVLVPPPAISDEALYWEFRRFLFESGTRQLWSGFARGLAFPREFEKGLQAATLRRLERGTSNNDAIVVHGQTGTGKTVALGALAYKVAAAGEYPTIFIERRTQRPSNADIDRCCQLFEDHGADGSLIVWDGMVSPSDYHELQGYLASRGRKAVVVGSTYKLQETGRHLIEVPDQLSSSEAEQFTRFLENFGVEINSQHREALENRDPSYLVALYRLLPPARPRIRTGVVQELERLETDLVVAVNNYVGAEQPVTALAEAFLSAGIIDNSRLEEIQQSTQLKISPTEVAD